MLPFDSLPADSRHPTRHPDADEAIGPVRIGTSGWNYPSGRGAWSGVFYPPRSSAGRRGGTFDDLAFYAEHFDTVEVNSTFYRPPAAAVCRSWVRRTPPGFEFSLKLYQRFTHPEMIGRGRREPAASRRAGEPRQRIPQVGAADVDESRAGFEPIAASGRLGALLAQFPPSFHRTPEAQDYIAWLLGAFGDYPVAVELRHRSWSDDIGGTLELLNGFGAAWVQIDEPKFRFSIRQNFLPNVTGFHYLRLHGRNAAKWWRHDTAEERYDYLYSAEELRPFRDTADAARRLVRKVYLYMNNHFAAKSVANAVMLKHQLGIPISGEYPASFAERYPDLAPLVATSPRPLSRTPS